MQPNKPNYGGLADSICAMIRDERNAVDEVLRDAARFLDELPDDIGRGSLNGWKVQLRHKIGEMLPPNALAQADAACGVSPGAMGSAAG